MNIPVKLRPLSEITRLEMEEVCRICGWNINEYDGAWFVSEFFNKGSDIQLPPIKFVPLVSYLNNLFDLKIICSSGGIG